MWSASCACVPARALEVRFLDGTPSDVAEPAAKLMTGVLATVNEVDSQIKSINVLNGLKRRKAAGYYACGSLPVWLPQRRSAACCRSQKLEGSQTAMGAVGGARVCTAAVHPSQWPELVSAWANEMDP